MNNFIINLFQFHSTIMEGQVIERSFLEYLHELNHKISFLYEKSPHEIKCFNEVHDIIYKLKIKVKSFFFKIIFVLIL